MNILEVSEGRNVDFRYIHLALQSPNVLACGLLYTPCPLAYAVAHHRPVRIIRVTPREVPRWWQRGLMSPLRQERALG